MCDSHTVEDFDADLARHGITRREFAAMTTAAALTACAPAEQTANNSNNSGQLRESAVSIVTQDGTADAFFVHPGEGRHPGVIMWPDIAGLRGAYEIMARRLANAGYAVLVPNPYYRSAKAPILTSLSQWFEPAMQAKLTPMIAQVDGMATARDAAAFTAWLDGQDAVDPQKGLATCGYCMGGSHAVRTTAAAKRIKAACSFHGAKLVTDAPDSPYRLIKDSQANYLFAIARDDDAQHPEEKTVLRQAADEAHRPAEIEVYPAGHGWCTVDAPSYDKEQAEKAWNRMLATFQTAL